MAASRKSILLYSRYYALLPLVAIGAVADVKASAGAKCFDDRCGCPPHFKEAWCTEASTLTATWATRSEASCEASNGVWCIATSVATATILSDAAQDGATLEMSDIGSQQAVIEKFVHSVVSLEPAGLDFYKKAAKSMGKLGGLGCIVGGVLGGLAGSSAGPIGAAAGAAKGCGSASFVSGLLAALDAPGRRWSQATQAAYRARKAYRLSFGWLELDPYDVVGVDVAKAKATVNKANRDCAKRYHPDKVWQRPETHRKIAQTKLANCEFARTYIPAFQGRYGNLDPFDEGQASKKFLIDFAGAWAATLFGSNDKGSGALSQAEVDEWMSEIKHFTKV